MLYAPASLFGNFAPPSPLGSNEKLPIPAKRYGKISSLMLKSKITPAPMVENPVRNSCGSRLESLPFIYPTLPKALRPNPLCVQAGKKYSSRILPV